MDMTSILPTKGSPNVESRGKRVILAGGGTGGHFFPALAVAEALRARAPDVNLNYFGTTQGPERKLAESHGLPYQGIASGQVRGKSALKAAYSLASTAAGTVGAAFKLNAPDAVFATGGYASVPVVSAAWLRRVPAVVFLPDVEAGWAVRSMVRIAARIGVSNEVAGASLPAEKTVVTGYPVRKRFFELDRRAARESLGLSGQGSVLLISGASSGAQRLNDAVAPILSELLKLTEVIHSTGTANFEEIEARSTSLPAELRARYHVYPLIEDMAAAMHAADLAIMRAGASVLGELPAAGLPAVLVPGSFAGGHQRSNAQALAAAGAAVVLEESDYNELLPMVSALLRDKTRLEAMAHAARSLARPEAADRLAEIVLEVAR
jgi:UDP-N-acetylglucosamine--N-acetylmuramyl-(pentapeptide) pyrophosphoryl-undecaprenol N-acetylglucosamine transferase